MQPSTDVLHTNRHLSYRQEAAQQLLAPDAAPLRFAPQLNSAVRPFGNERLEGSGKR
jgi:hypothetical protein